MVVSNVTANLCAVMQRDPGAVIETTAKEYNSTSRAVVEALPESMRRFAPGTCFGEAMGEIARWCEVTVIVHTDDAIFEFTGPVPPGQFGRGYFNLPGKKGLHGHLRHEHCAALAFVERPFRTRSSAFVSFFNRDGGIMFKVFVGRDERGELKEEQLAMFRDLADRLCADS